MLPFLLVVFIFCFLTNASAQAPSVVINEVAWMGTAASANQEWLELYNPGAGAVDLTGWKILADDGSPDIALTGSIAPQGYFLLERTSDSTVNNVTADQIYSGALSNTAEQVSLLAAGGAIVDRLTAWHAGANDPKATMIRINPALPGTDSAAWGTSTINAGATDSAGGLIIGSPRVANEQVSPQVPANEGGQENANQPNSSGSNNNSSATSSPEPPNFTINLTLKDQKTGAYLAVDQVSVARGGTLDLKAEGNASANDLTWYLGDGTSKAGVSQLTRAYNFPGRYFITLEAKFRQMKATDQLEVFVYATGIMLSEFLPNPKGADGDGEWLEIGNTGDYLADIGGFIIEAGANALKRYVLPSYTYVFPRGFLVVPMGDTNLTLGNSEGAIKLFYPNELQADGVTYDDAPEGESAIRRGDEFIWTSKPTPGFGNVLNPAEPKAEAAGEIKNVVKSSPPVNSKGYLNSQTLKVESSKLVAQVFEPPASSATLGGEIERLSSPILSYKSKGEDNGALDSTAKLAEAPGEQTFVLAEANKAAGPNFRLAVLGFSLVLALGILYYAYQARK